MKKMSASSASQLWSFPGEGQSKTFLWVRWVSSVNPSNKAWSGEPEIHNFWSRLAKHKENSWSGSLTNAVHRLKRWGKGSGHLGNGIPQHFYHMSHLFQFGLVAYVWWCTVVIPDIPSLSTWGLSLCFPSWISYFPCLISFLSWFGHLLLVSTSPSSFLGNCAWRISILRPCISTNTFTYLL